jgi:hypothetical protein
VRGRPATHPPAGGRPGTRSLPPAALPATSPPVPCRPDQPRLGPDSALPEKLVELFRRQTVATFPELAAALETSADRTVFRKLAVLDYTTSCSQRGAYYTLQSLAATMRRGCWSHDDVHFSRFGTLLDTAGELATRAPSPIRSYARACSPANRSCSRRQSGAPVAAGSSDERFSHHLPTCAPPHPQKIRRQTEQR